MGRVRKYIDFALKQILDLFDRQSVFTALVDIAGIPIESGNRLEQQCEFICVYVRLSIHLDSVLYSQGV